jgi:hypothetical protein
MTAIVVLPCTNCGKQPVNFSCLSDECKKRRGFDSSVDWNNRQASNAVLRLIGKYKEIHNGVHPHALTLPQTYIDCLLPEFRQRIFAVDLIAKAAA